MVNYADAEAKAPFGQIKSKPISKSQGTGDYFYAKYLLGQVHFNTSFQCQSPKAACCFLSETGTNVTDTLQLAIK